MEQPTNTIPQVEPLKKPVFEDPLAFVSKDIKAKAGGTPPEQQQAQGTTNNSFLETAKAQASQINNSGFAFKNFDVNFQDAFQTLNSGDSVRKFESFERFVNNEDRLAKQQTTGEKWLNGLQKFQVKTATAVLGGTVGTVEGIINGINQGSLEAVFNSDFNNWLDDLNTKVDFKLPNYYTEQEKEAGFIDSLGSANFWANDVLGGLSFTVGTIVSEGIWAAATGGTSLIARRGLTAARLANWSTKARGVKQTLKGLQKATSEIKRPYIAASKAKKVFDQARFLTTSAGYEAGFEARHFMKETEQEFVRNFEQQFNRKPNAQELGEFRNNLADSANSVFATNLALVGFSNQVVLGKLLLGKSTTKTLTNNALKRKLFGVGFDKLEDGTFKALTPTKFQKTLSRLYGFAKPAVTEGFIEEGGQAVTSNTAKNYLLSAYSNDGTNENLSIAEAFYESLAETYGTKEGFKEVGIGALIGLIGGGISSGGRFNDISQERNFVQDRVNYRNQFTADNVVDRIKANNKIFEANRRGEEAKAAGDLTGELLSEREAMIASIERDFHFEGAAEGLETFTTAIEGVDNNLIAEDLGISVEEAEAWKKDKIEKYSQLSKDYDLNKRFAESILGTGDIAGLKKGIAKTEIEKAIAYNITMGTEVDNLATDYVERIKEEIGENFSDSGIIEALDVDNLLRKVDEKTQRDYNNAAKKQKNLLKRREQLETSLRKVQQEPTREENVDNTQRLNQIQEQLLSVQEELDQVAQEKELLVGAMELQFPDSNEIITEEMLDNQADKARRLDSLIETLKDTSPDKYGRIHKLLQEYERATKVTKQYQRTTKAILDPNLRVTEINGWLDKLIKGKKELNDFSKEFFTDILNQYGADTVQNLEDNIAARAATDGANEGTTEGVNEGINQEQVDDITPPEQAPQEEISQIQSVRNLISDILGTNQYLVNYFGQDEEQVLRRKPSKKDIERYEELLGKIQTSNKNSVVLAEENPQDSGLTEEEFQEIKNINEKLADWRLLDGAVDGDGNSIASLVELLDQLEGTEVKENTKTEVTNKDFINLNKSIEKQKAQRATAATVQSPDVALVTLKADSFSNQELYEFSHLNVDTFQRLIPNSRLLFIDGNGVKKEFNSAPDSVKKKVSSTVGSKFVLETPSGELPITVREFKRLEVPATIMNSVLPSSNIKILNFGISRFLSVYEKVNDTEFRPLQGDFTYESTQKNETIKIDSNAVSRLKTGEILRLEVNLNDTFNADLLKRYNNGNGSITKKELESKMQVYVTNQKGQLLGSLRAFSKELPNSPITDKLIQARARASELAIENQGKSKIDLKTTVPVKTVLTGAPKLNLQEQADGSVTPTDLDFTLDAVKQVKAVGFARNGEITLDKKQNSKLNTIFVDSLTEGNNGEIVPVIVFENNNQRIAYPVSLKSTIVDKSSEIINILNTDLSSSDKLSKVYAVLSENGIDPSQFSVDISDENWIGSDAIQDILNSVRNVKDFVNVEAWAEGNYNYNNLVRDAAISIDITDNPFQTGKIILSLEELEIATDLNSREQISNNLEEVEELLSRFAIEVDREMRTNPEFVEINNSFTQVFDENAVEESPNSFQRKKNVRIVKESLGKTVPSNLQNIFGKERIKNMRKLVKKHVELSKQRAKQLTDIKNSKIKSEVTSQKTDC